MGSPQPSNPASKASAPRSIRRLSWVSLVALTLGLAALAGPACSAPRSPDGRDTVVVVLVDPRGRRLPFDPDALRARRAREALDRVAKRGISLAVDLALLPEDTEGREAYVADAMESLARALDELHRRSPAVFESSTAKLSEVAFRFDPLAHRVRAKLSEDGALLEARTSRPASPPLQTADYTYLLEERARELSLARYATRSADDVPRGERSAYFEALADSRNAPRDDAGRVRFHAERLLNVLRLYDLAQKDRDDSLAAKVRHDLATSGDQLFRDVAFHHAELFDRAPPDSPLRRAEAAYSTFLRREIGALDEGDQLAAVRAAFSRASPHDAQVQRYALPTLDRVGLAIDLLGDWKKRGGTSAVATPAIHAVVCPEERVRSGNRIATSRSGHCGDELYHLARTDLAARRALTAHALRTDDATFVRLLFGRLARDRAHLAGTFEEVRALHGTRLFGVAVEAVAAAVDGTGDPALVADARDLARALPDARGDVAYLVARALTYRGAEETFTRFGDLFGAPLELRDFERFMAYGDPAVQSTPAVIPAFAKAARGVPRMRVFLTRLDAFLDRAEERRAQHGPDRTLAELREQLCADDDGAGVAEVARALAERRRKRPGEGLTEVFAEGCPKREASPSAKPPGRKPRPKDGGRASDVPPAHATPKAPMPRAVPEGGR